jgi:hypothetical protein
MYSFSSIIPKKTAFSAIYLKIGTDHLFLDVRWKITNYYQAKWRDENLLIGHETDDLTLTSTLECTYGLQE